MIRAHAAAVKNTKSAVAHNFLSEALRGMQSFTYIS